MQPHLQRWLVSPTVELSSGDGVELEPYLTILDGNSQHFGVILRLALAVSSSP